MQLMKKPTDQQITAVTGSHTAGYYCTAMFPNIVLLTRYVLLGAVKAYPSHRLPYLPCYLQVACKGQNPIILIDVKTSSAAILFKLCH